MKFRFDPPHKAFTRLPEQVHRCRAEDQEATRSHSPPPPLIDQPAQFLEQLRYAVNFSKDNETMLVGFEEQCRVGQFVAVCFRFQIEIERIGFFGDFMCQSRFADLARADQGDGGLTAQGIVDGAGNTAMNYPCKLKDFLLNCKVSQSSTPPTDDTA